MNIKNMLIAAGIGLSLVGAAHAQSAAGTAQSQVTPAQTTPGNTTGGTMHFNEGSATINGSPSAADPAVSAPAPHKATRHHARHKKAHRRHHRHARVPSSGANTNSMQKT